MVARILLATIKNLGLFPCPRCHIAKTDIRGVGKQSDRDLRRDERRPTKQLSTMVKKARRAIFKGSKISGIKVEKLLGSRCHVAVNVSLKLALLAHTVLKWGIECIYKLPSRRKRVRTPGGRPAP
jgi:hypothetical protein